MNAREWALISFTILSQLAVGTFLVSELVGYFLRRKYSSDLVNRLINLAHLIIVPSMLVALFASLLHLGKPLYAYRAINNLESSWISREILFGLVFTLLIIIYSFSQWRKFGSKFTRNLLAWLTALAGVLLVLSMSTIYTLPTQPTWNEWTTPLNFFTTTLMLGAVSIGAASVTNYFSTRHKETGQGAEQTTLNLDAIRWTTILAVVMLGVEIIALTICLGSLAAGSETARECAQLMTGQFGWLLLLRVSLAFLGASILGVFLYNLTFRSQSEGKIGYLVYSAFVLVFVAEVLGRFLFYATNPSLV